MTTLFDTNNSALTNSYAERHLMNREFKYRVPAGLEMFDLTHTYPILRNKRGVFVDTDKPLVIDKFDTLKYATTQNDKTMKKVNAK